MKTRAGMFLVGLGALLAAAAASPAGAPLAQLESSGTRLACTNHGLALTPPWAAGPRAGGAGEALWTLRLQSTRSPGETLELSSADQTPDVETVPGGCRLGYRQLSDGEQSTHPISLTLDVRARDAAFVVGGMLRNGTKEWRVVAFTGPVISGLEANLALEPLLVPYGFGMQVRSVPAVPTRPATRAPAWVKLREGVMQLRADYPSYEASMPWLAFAGGESGLYLGVHDPRQAGKALLVTHDAATARFAAAFEHPLACAPGKSWELPATEICLYQGSWHTAARRYRAWYDTVRPPPASLDWVRRSSGWLLAILKQQNEEILWDYAAVAKLCDVADARGLDIISLFGWTAGGHDRWYPVYEADERMGGEAQLRRSIAEAHRRGKRMVIYYNGQLIDQDFAFWKPKGRSMTVLEQDGRYAFQSWQKYRDTPARIHGLACLASEAWYECLLELALKAQRLGADGIIYDQLGMTAPMTCHAAGHGHAVPAVVYAEDRTRLLRRIAEHMAKVQPDFLVMTEGLHDTVLDSVSFFHGCVLGVFSPTVRELGEMQGGPAVFAQFPDLFRYTFPEVLTTLRNPRPVEERRAANYACLYGFRHEIETRYAPDKAYLLAGVVPEAKDYANMVSKPNVAVMRETSQQDAVRYLRALVQFQRDHADLLWEGRFVGDEGFVLDGPSTLMAKAYTRGDRLGVVLWNTGKAAVPVRLSAPGYRFEQAWSPDAGSVAPDAPLAPDSIRLVVGVKR